MTAWLWNVCFTLRYQTSAVADPLDKGKRPIERDARTIPEGRGMGVASSSSFFSAVSSVRRARIVIDDALPQRPDHILHDQRVLPAVR